MSAKQLSRPTQYIKMYLDQPGEPTSWYLDVCEKKAMISGKSWNSNLVEF